MSGFPHALVIGFVASLIALFGIMLRNRAWVLTSMLLSLSTASPMVTFTRGAAGAIVPSDAVAVVLLLGLMTGAFRDMSSPVAPSWRKPFVILVVIWTASIILISSWNMPDLNLQFGGRVRSAIPLPLNMQITIFRLFRISLLVVFFVVISKLSIDDRDLRLIFKLFCTVTVGLAIASILTRLGIMDLRLNSIFTEERGGGELVRGYILGYTKALANRILFVGLFVTLILVYKSTIFKPLYIGISVLIVAALFLGGSRAGILGMAVGLIVLSLRTGIARLPFVLMATGLLVLLGFAMISYWVPEALETYKIFLPGVEIDTGRENIAQWTVEYLLSHLHVLLTGVGFMNYSYALASAGAISEHAHNDFLTCLTETGLIGFIVFIWWLVSLGKSIWLAGRYASGEERWVSACINAAFWGLVSVMFFETTLFPAGSSVSANRLEIVLLGSFTAYYAQAYSWQEQFLYQDEYDEATLCNSDNNSQSFS